MYIKNDRYLECIKGICTEDFSGFKNKSFLITGAGGLIGSFVVDTLMYLNDAYDLSLTVYATFTSEASYQGRFKSYIYNPALKPVICDLTAGIPAEGIAADYVIHTAAACHPALFAEHPVETIKLGVTGSVNVIELARKLQARLLYLSSTEVYGEGEDDETCFTEDRFGAVDFNNPRSCYPEGKRLAETLCHAYVKEYDADIVIARLSYIFGPTVKRGTSRADVQFLTNALNHQNIVLKSDGLQRRSYLFVADAAAALLKLLMAGKQDEVYNVANPQSIRLRDFAAELAGVAGVKLEFGSEGEIEKQGGCKVRNSAADPSKLMSLGWSPQFTLHEALDLTYRIKRELMVKA